MFAQAKKLGPQLNCGPEAKEGLGEGGIGGKGNDGIGGKVMWLETEKIEKGSEEVRGGESEPALEVSDEHHPLAGFRSGAYLIAGSAANHLGANPT